MFLESTEAVRGPRSPGTQRSSVLYALLFFVSIAPLIALGARAQTHARLAGIRTISVGSMGASGVADTLRLKVIERLKKSKRLKVVDDAAGADVILRGDSNIWATGTVTLSPHSKSATMTMYQGYLSAELVSSTGQTLWSYLVTPSRFRTASITDDLADQMVSRLLDAIASGAARENLSDQAGRSHVALSAAGSTLAAPLYRKWFESSGMEVSYEATGSEAGIEALAAGKIDLAASDMRVAEGAPLAASSVIQIATVLGGVVPIYNLPSLDHALNFTPQVLAGIYLGSIRKWNDPRIAEANRGARLPDEEIQVVHRSDGSGTTFVWTSYLSLISPEWKTAAGTGARLSWPVGSGAAGNDGVADLVNKTPNSIGYVELIYAIQHQLNYGAVKNPAGEFVKADLAGITAAATGAKAGRGENAEFGILNQPGRDAYPISTFTWLIVPVEGASAEKRAAIADLLKWALTAGQKECASLGYAPLPHEIASSELNMVKAWAEKK
ncbi:MAG TPA: phosphate ABC transporter substrate-binding protein PstS [Terracidiphilus sp.]|nr:phosphate ABC transporter substrate-binding protein PstS [Terracidiphilus sp.]